MTKTIAALFAATFVLATATAASAQDPQLVVTATTAQAAHAKLLAAAERVCSAARAQDPFDDYGSQEECIENTLDRAVVTHRPYQAQYTQSQVVNRAAP